MRKAAIDLINRQVVVGDKIGVPTGTREIAKAIVKKITPKGCRADVFKPLNSHDEKTGQTVVVFQIEDRVFRDFNFVKLEIPQQGVYKIWET